MPDANRSASAFQTVAPLSGELKFVTAFRCDLVASTELVRDLGPEQAVEILQPPLAEMREAVRSHRGIVCHELGDGILAVFGAPVATDNHAVAAIYAALDVVARLRQLNADLNVRIGIHSGSVVARVISTDLSSIYDIGGPVLNMVERLQASAGVGEILVSAPAQRLAEGFLTFEEPHWKHLRGFSKPELVFRAIAAADLSRWQIRASRSLSNFVGRVAELAQLDEVAQLAPASAECVCIIGEPGVGKSRLAHEFTSRLRGNGWQVIEVECDSLHAMAPYAALRHLFLLALACDTCRSADGESMEFAAALSPDSRNAINVILDRTDVDAAWQQASPSSRSRAIATAWRDILSLLGGIAKTIVLIEDLHWLDEASGDVIRDALGSDERRDSVLTLITARSGTSIPVTSNVRKRQIQLGPLDQHAASALLQSLRAVANRSQVIDDRILTHTGRIPLFIEEVCRQIAEEEQAGMKRSFPESRFDPNGLSVPATVQGVIASRLDRLSPSARGLVQVASIFGLVCDLALLKSVSALDEPAFQRHVRMLGVAEILFVEDRGGEALVFPHDLVRQVAYESMLESTRGRWHGTVLAALEKSQSPGDQTDRRETLCHHAMRARNWSKTFEYARAIVRRCVERSAFANACAFTDIALDALDRLPFSTARECDAIDFRIEARRVLADFGRIDRMLSLAKEAAERAAAIGDSARVMNSRAVHSAALNFYGDAFQAVGAGTEVLQQAEMLGDMAWINYARYGLGQAYFMAGRYRDAERMLGLALAQLASSDARTVLATTAMDFQLMCSMMLTLTSVGLGELTAADASQKSATALARESAKPYGRVAAGYGSGVFFTAVGDRARARASLEEALALAVKSDVALFVPVVTCQLGIAMLEDGRIDLAISALREASAGARRIGHRSAYLRSDVNSGLALLALGRRGIALRSVRKARLAAARGGFAGIEAEAAIAEAAVLGGSSAQCRTAAIRLLADGHSIASRIGAEPLVKRSTESFIKLMTVTISALEDEPQWVPT